MTYVFRSLKEHDLSLSFQLDDIKMEIKFVNGCYETDDDNLGQYLLDGVGKDYLENSKWKKVPDEQIESPVVLDSPVDLKKKKAATAKRKAMAAKRKAATAKIKAMAKSKPASGGK